MLCCLLYTVLIYYCQSLFGSSHCTDDFDLINPWNGSDRFIEFDRQLICECDLISDICDALCCCDTDCTSNELDSYSCHHEIQPLEDDSNYCSYYIERKLAYPLPYNFLCVYYDNNRARRFYHHREPLASLNDFKTLLESTGEMEFFPSAISFPDQWISDTRQLIHLSHDPVLNRQYLELPLSMGLGTCNSWLQVEMLVDENSYCVLMLHSLNESCTSTTLLSAETYYKDVIILMPVTPIPIISHLCHFTFDNCEQSDDMPLPVYDPESTTCMNVVQSMRYEIQHRGSHEIKQIDAKFILTDVIDKDTRTKLKQKYHATFRWYERDVIPVSGNPGYQQGLPVLGGKWNGRDKVEFNGNPWMVLPQAGRNGHCEMLDLTLNFNEEIVTSCIVEAKSQSLKETCLSLSEQLIEHLFNLMPSHIGAYGDSDPRRLGDWVPVLRTNSLSPSEFCSDVSLALNCEILYTHIGMKSNAQAKIIGVRYQYAPPINLLKLCTNEQCQSADSKLYHMKASLSIHVKFIEVTPAASPTFAPLPTINLKLPRDFLYPFVSSTTASSSVFHLIIAAIFIHISLRVR